MGGDVGRGKEPELRQRRRLVYECYYLAVAEIASSSGERRYFAGLGKQTDVIGNDTRRTHAGPENFNASRVAFALWIDRSAQVLRWILCIVGVVGGADHSLVGKDVNS